jgi:hypothetical protein
MLTPEVKFDRQKLILLLAVWTAFGLFFGTQGYIREIYLGRNASLTGYIVSWIFCGYSWAILTLPVLLFTRRFSLERVKLPRFFLVHVLASVLFSLAQLGIYLLIAGVLFSRPDRSLWDFYKFLLASELQSSILVYFVIVAVITAYDRFLNKDSVEQPHDFSEGIPSQVLPVPKSNGTNGFLRRISVKENGKIVLVDVDHINWIESYGNYLFLHTPDRKFIYRETMAAIEKKLDPAHFVRIRRSAIVKIDHIRELYPTDNGEFEIVLNDGNVLISTRRYRKNLEPVLKS